MSKYLQNLKYFSLSLEHSRYEIFCKYPVEAVYTPYVESVTIYDRPESPWDLEPVWPHMAGQMSGEERGERREEREGHCQGEGLRPPVRGEKAAPGVVLGATFLNVYFMPESKAGGGFILSCPPHSPVSQLCLGISNGIIDSQPCSHHSPHTDNPTGKLDPNCRY